MPLRTAFAALASLIAWAALALQLALIVDRMTAEGATTVQAAWRFLGFFTVLANVAVAVEIGRASCRERVCCKV